MYTSRLHKNVENGSMYTTHFFFIFWSFLSNVTTKRWSQAIFGRTTLDDMGYIVTKPESKISPGLEDRIFSK